MKTTVATITASLVLGLVAVFGAPATTRPTPRAPMTLTIQAMGRPAIALPIGIWSCIVQHRRCPWM